MNLVRLLDPDQGDNSRQPIWYATYHAYSGAPLCRRIIAESRLRPWHV